MLISEIDLETLSDEQTAHLVMGDQQYNGATADVIFVFGGLAPARVTQGARLYHAGKAPYIHFAGGTKFGQRLPAEAVTMREEASMPYHMRRSMLALKTYMPACIEPIWSAVDLPGCGPNE